MKIGKKVLAVLMAVVCVLSMSAAAFASPAVDMGKNPSQVSTMATTQLHCYTDYYNGKPSLYIWTPDNHQPNWQKTNVKFNYVLWGWMGVAVYGGDNKLIDYGINIERPQHHTTNGNGGWWIYHISSTWIGAGYVQGTSDWDNDARWLVYEDQ